MILPLHLEDVSAALALDDFDAAAAQYRMAPRPRVLRRSPDRPGKPRQAATLVLLYPRAGEWTFVLTRRAEHPHDVHSGQISLPGGSQEPGESAIQTALRETQEEVGFGGPIEILGTLTPLYIPPSDFQVQPVVGWADPAPVWRPDPVEVAEVLDCPVAWLLDESRKRLEDWHFNDYDLRVPWYDFNGHRVWGATAIMLSEFEQRLRRVLNWPSLPDLVPPL